MASQRIRRVPFSSLSMSVLDHIVAKKRVLWNKLKTVVILITDGRWNQGPSPVPIAKMLHAANIEVFAIGVGNVITPDTLQEVVRDPAKQAFHLKDFAEFDELSLYVRGGK